MSSLNFVFLISLGFVVKISFTHGHIVNEEVNRVIDISTQLVVIHYNITLQNEEQSATRTINFFVEPDVRKSLSYIEASIVGSSNKDRLVISEIKEDEFQDAVAWQINLKKQLRRGQIIKIEIISVFTHQLFPYPVHIFQSENQLVNYTGNYYFYSPYFSKKQTTSVICSSDAFESYTTLQPTSQLKNVITYGPYENIHPFSVEKLTVHYENNENFLTVTNMERVIEVSHWGNIAVEETIELLHSGAILKGPFSRLDFLESQKNNPKGVSSVASFTTILPASAKDVYYKDVIGNISSSHLRVLADSVELDIQLRFPLFGGWKINCIVGYNVPSYEYLYNNGEDYILQMRVLDHIYDNMVVDELITKIILPEYSTDIWLFTPFPMVRLPDSKHYSYLDVVGRPVIIVAKNNMIEYHIQDFELHYVFANEMLFVEPIITILVLYLILIIVIIIIRLDFSIAPENVHEKHPKGSSLMSKKSCQKYHS